MQNFINRENGEFEIDFFPFYLLNTDISLGITPALIKSSICIGNILIEGRSSQIVYSGSSLLFRAKNG